MPPKISICIMARDEAEKIARALRSAAACDWCDELLVADTGSLDRTVEIAEQCGARVVRHQWIDFSTNRVRMVDAARNHWVFVLDADEQISPALASEIAAVREGWFEAHSVVEIPRRNYLLGRHARAWDPDYVCRLFDRRRSHHERHPIHDSRRPDEGLPGRLGNPILHNPEADDFTDYFDGTCYQSRTEMAAREKFDRGCRVGPLGLLFRPWAAFLKFYLLRGGFREGSFGLLLAQKAAFSTQLKYARLWHMQQQQAEGERGAR